MPGAGRAGGGVPHPQQQQQQGDTGNFPSPSPSAPRGVHGGRTKLQRLLFTAQKQNCGGGVAGAGRGTRHRGETDNATSSSSASQVENSILLIQIATGCSMISISTLFWLPHSFHCFPDSSLAVASEAELEKQDTWRNSQISATKSSDRLRAKARYEPP